VVVRRRRCGCVGWSVGFGGVVLVEVEEEEEEEEGYVAVVAVRGK
jgi:hypothetical protein